MNVFYFAYGSNMQGETFRGRRGIRPLSAAPVRVPGWKLVVDKPSMLPLRQSFANVVTEAGAVVYGVLYELSEDDHVHVELTEAVPFGNYRRVEVEAHPLDGGAPRLVRTLTSDRRDGTLRPSSRYVGLMIEGAIEHGLPEEWIEGLRALPTCEEGPEDLDVRRQMDELLRAVTKAKRGE